MNARRLVRLYPAAWRDRYGAELDDLLERQPASPRLVVDVLVGAIDAHLHPSLAPAAATQHGAGLVPRILACRPTPAMLVSLIVLFALYAVLGLVRRTYGFNWGIDFFFYASMGLAPMLWTTYLPSIGVLRRDTRRLLVLVGSSVLAGLLGTLLTNGSPF